MEKSIIAAFKKYERFIVTMHVNPDPDALGAALAMTLFLRSKGKKVRLVAQDECPKWLTFMPRAGLIEKLDEKKHKRFDAEVMIVLDSGDFNRAGAVTKLLHPGMKVINIDHHFTNTNFGHWNHVQVKYSSTSEILFQLLKRAHCRFTKDIAVLLYLGILTDTGSFGFDCTSSHTHEVIAELLQFGFSVSDLYRQVYETMPKEDLKSFLALANRLELHNEERVACLVMTKKDVSRFSGDFDLKDRVFTFLRVVKGLELIIILTEQDAKKTRLNFRSRGAVDVAKLASKFNGGGHKKASGGFIEQDLVGARRAVLAAVGKVL